MGWLRAARAVGGILSLIVLLALIVLDFWFPGRTLSSGMIGLLVLLIGGLLAVDRLLEGGVITISFDGDEGDNGP